MKDYEGALDYYQQALSGHEKVLGKTHPDTLMTITNTVTVYMEDSKVFTKAEEMFRLAVDGYKKSLGKDHAHTKRCAENFAISYCFLLKSKEKAREVFLKYPHVVLGFDRTTRYIREFIR